MQEKVRIVAIVALSTAAIFSATLAINLTIQSAHANGIIQFAQRCAFLAVVAPHNHNPVCSSNITPGPP